MSKTILSVSRELGIETSLLEKQVAERQAEPNDQASVLQVARDIVQSVLHHRMILNQMEKKKNEVDNRDHRYADLPSGEKGTHIMYNREQDKHHYFEEFLNHF